jgi:2-methylcitrate dehydratase PrpD
MDVNDYAVKFIHNLKFKDLPPQVLRQAKICLLDLVGACIAGAQVKGAKILADFSSHEMGRNKEATVIQAKKKVSCVAASLINGFIANALDIDDGYRKIKGHPGSAVFPTVLTISEKVEASGKQFLEAFIIGYEIGIRAGEILHSHYGYYHGSGSWGAMGSAAGAAKLFRLSEDQTKNALGIAEAYAPLIPEIRAVEHPAMAPKDGITWGALVGTSAVLLAQKGYTASPSLLGDSKRNREVFTLGKEYKILNLYFKRYPCCRWAHPAIDGLMKIMKEKKLNHREISKIMIRSFSEAVSLCQTPPTSLEDAEYNVIYPVAITAIYGEFTPTYLKEKYFKKREILQLMEKIRIVQDPKIQKKFPEHCYSEIEVRTKQGKTYRSGLIPAKGDFDFPLSEKELEEKFMSLVKEKWSEKKIGQCIEVIKHFEKYPIRDLIRFLA